MSTSTLATRRLEILARRSLELADRVASGEIKFLDAVDVAYEAAVWSGLVEAVGDDIVQAIRCRSSQRSKCWPGCDRAISPTPKPRKRNAPDEPP